MFHRGMAVLAFLAIGPAHAALIEYSFNSTVLEGSSVPDVSVGDAITGGFLFDDTAPTISSTVTQICTPLGAPCAPWSRATYDISNMLMWVTVGDSEFTLQGDQLHIADFTRGDPSLGDEWLLHAHGDDADIRIDMRQWSGKPLTSSALQVSDAADWAPNTTFRTLYLSLNDGLIQSELWSITKTPTSVPEPGTLSLLVGGVLGALTMRARKRAGAK